MSINEQQQLDRKGLNVFKFGPLLMNFFLGGCSNASFFLSVEKNCLESVIE